MEIPRGELADDDDELDASDVDFTEDLVGDEELPLVALAPDGDPATIEKYAFLFGAREDDPDA